MTGEDTPITGGSPWLDGLPETVQPDVHTDPGCPWSRYAEADHDSWGYRYDDILVIRSHEEAKAVLSDRGFRQGLHARIAEKAPNLDPQFVARRRDALLGREGPDHIRMRRISSKAAFTPRAANRHRPLMQSIMAELADRIPADGVCNAIDLVHEYPSRVIAEVLGGRKDEVTSFASLVETIFDAARGVPEAVPHAWDAMQQLDAHILDLIERKQAEPGEDLMSDLIRAETEDGVLATQEVHDIAVAVVMAGTETTRSALTRGLQILAEHPDAWAAIGDEHQLTAAVEEILRYAPLAPIWRVSSEALDVADIVVPDGQLIVLDLGAANRDPEVFDEPHTFRLDRTNAAQHLSLSHGRKYCLGANLAKAELAEALRVLRARFRTLELAAPPVWINKGIPRGESVLLHFDN